MRFLVFVFLMFSSSIGYSKILENQILLWDSDDSIKLVSEKNECQVKIPIKFKSINNIMYYKENYLIITYKNNENIEKLSIINLKTKNIKTIDYPKDDGLKILRHFAYYLINKDSIVITEVYRNGKADTYISKDSRKINIENIKKFKKRIFLRDFNQKGESLYYYDYREFKNILYYFRDMKSEVIKIFEHKNIVRSNFTNNSKNIIFLTLNRLKDGSKNFDLYNYNISTKKIEKIHTFNLTKTEGGYPDYYIFKSTPYIMFKKSKSANNLNLTDKNFIIQNIETKEYKDFNIPINENINLASSMSIDSLDNYNLKNNLYGYDTKIIQDKWLKFDVKTRLVNKIFYAVDLLTLKTIVSYNYQGKGIKEALYIDKIEVDDSFLSKE